MSNTELKFSKETIEIFSNFSAINNSIVFKPGTLVGTVSVRRDFVANANIAEELPQEFAIYNFSEFLNVLGLFDDPTIRFFDDHVLIYERGKKVMYHFASPDVIQNKVATPNVSNIFTEFKIPWETYNSLIRAARTMGMGTMRIYGKDGQLFVEVQKEDIDDSFTIEIEDVRVNDFDAYLDISVMKLLEDDYDVSISSDGVVVWKGCDVTYWQAIDKEKSQFSE